jgi:hypothetical protein
VRFLEGLKRISDRENGFYKDDKGTPQEAVVKERINLAGSKRMLNVT